MKNFDFVILKTQQHLMRERFLSAINIKYKNVCMNFIYNVIYSMIQTFKL